MARRPPGNSLLLLCLTVVVGCGRNIDPPRTLGTGPVSVSLNPTEIRAGDRAHLTVIVDHPVAGNVSLPELNAGKAVVVVDQKRETSRLAADSGGALERTTFDLFLTSFEIGDHCLGTGKITLTAPDGQAREIPFPEATLRTRSVLSAIDTPMRESKGLANWPAPISLWAGIAVGLFLLAGAIALGSRRRLAEPRRTPVEGPLSLSPYETALRALAALQATKPTREQEVESFYRELSAIARRYIEDRFGLRAPEQTTDELLAAAAGSVLLAPIHQELVKVLLTYCDLVKFARFRPLPGNMARAFGAAERLVRETKPSGEPEPTTSGAVGP